MFLALLLACVGLWVCNIAYIVQLLIKERPGLACFFFFCGGGLFAFFHGWTTAREWNNQPMMIAWSVCLACFLVFFAIALIPFIFAILLIRLRFMH